MPKSADAAAIAAERAHLAQMIGADAVKWLSRAMMESAAGRPDLVESQISHARQLFLEAVAALDGRSRTVALPALPARLEAR
jgi:hypothetical protein